MREQQRALTLHPFSGFRPCSQDWFWPHRERPCMTAKVLRFLLSGTG